MRSHPHWLALTVLLSACPQPVPDGTITGTVVDTAGVPLVGATASLDGATATTDEDGVFSFEHPPAELLPLVVAQPGYVTVSRRVSVLPGGASTVTFTLLHEAAPIHVESAEDGFEVTGDRGAAMLAPPAALVHTDGRPVTGAIDVFLTPMDPSVAAELDAFPGELRGVRTAGSEVILESWGVLEATVRQDGEELAVADGSTLTLRIPPPGDDRTPPATVATWWHDEATDAWIEDGEASFEAATGTFVTEVSHLTPFNCDRPIIPGCIRGIVRDAAGNGVAGAEVRALSEPLGTVSYDHTDADGYYCLYVERQSELTLEVYTLDTGDCGEGRRVGRRCVTTRTAESGAAAASAAYPASCDRSCTVIAPSIEVGAPDPGPEARCTIETGRPDPFAGRCGNALSSIFSCWAPSGTCEYTSEEIAGSGFSMTLEYENGARAESSFEPLGGYVMVYTDASGRECGRAGTDLFGGLQYTTPSGETVEVDVADDGTTYVTCGGQTDTLTPAQLDVLSTCAPSVAGMAGSASTTVAGCRPREGTVNGRCIGGLTCEGDLECCSRIGEQPTCQPQGLCDAICNSDADCLTPLVCCAIAGYTICTDGSVCS